MNATKCVSVAPSKISHSTSTSTDVTPLATPDTSRPNTPLAGHILAAKSGPKGTSRRARKAVSTSVNVSSGDEDSKKRSKPMKAQSKKMRRWDADGLADDDDDISLDYSATLSGTNGTEELTKAQINDIADIKAEDSGTRTGKGQFILKDLDDEVHSILAGASAQNFGKKAPTEGVIGSSFSAISGLFRNVVGGKVLAKADLDKSMKGMEEHLLNKNVAREAAVRLCEGVERGLIGVKTGSFESNHALRTDRPGCSCC